SRRRHTRSDRDWSSDVCSSDLDLDGDPDLVLANGAIPVVKLAKDARRIQILENVAGPGNRPTFASVKAPWLARTPAVNGRGLAEIGRASCRERGQSTGVDGGVQ